MNTFNLDKMGEREESLHVDFVYPDEEPQEDMQKGMQEFLVRLLALLFASDNIRLTLAAYCISVGVDMTYLMGTNSESDIAKKLGVSRQTLNTTVKRICEENGIQKPIKKNEKQSNKYAARKV
jgi:hypothetical protein